MRSMNGRARGRAHRIYRVVMALGLLVSGVHGAVAADVSWNSGDGVWSDPDNWIPSGLPGTDVVYRIGNIPGVANHTVLLDVPSVGFDFLVLATGMTLDMNGNKLVGPGHAWISNDARLIARPVVGPGTYAYEGVVHLQKTATIDLRDDVSMLFTEDSESFGMITGRGTIVSNDLPFSNNGVIRPDNNGGIRLNGGILHDMPVDLDGAGNRGHVQLDVPFSQLTVNASGLADTFTGKVSMVPGALLTMNVDDGWVADSVSVVNVAGFGNPAAASQIAGTDWTFAGTLNVGAAEGHLRVLAPTTLEETAAVNIGATDWVEFDGATTVLGGQYSLGQGGRLDFDGPTTVRGGEFTTVSSDSVDGAVNFNGPTTWNGEATINGVARQVGDATVSGASVINAGILDMDGNGATTWNINNNLVVNTTMVDSTLSNTFDGTLNVGGGFLSRLTVHLTGATPSWTMAGDMNLAGDNSLFITRLGGAPVRIAGDVSLPQGRAQISADATFADLSSIDLALPSSTLRMNGHTVVESGALFIGDGTLQNGPAGAMQLDDGVDLNGVALINQGLLDVAEEAGIASVDRFTNTADGTWHVELGGYAAGTEYDVLLVAGGAAMLDGRLEVSLLDAGDGLFAPQVGDTFTVLTALGDVTGEFANDPVTAVGTLVYDWTVVYGEHAVTLVLADITPEPGSLALLGLGACVLCRRRRRRTGRGPTRPMQG